MRKNENNHRGGGIRSRLVAAIVALAMLGTCGIAGTALAADSATDTTVQQVQTAGNVAGANEEKDDARVEAVAARTVDKSVKSSDVAARDDGSAVYSVDVPVAGGDGASAGSVTVDVTAPAGALPDGVTLEAAPVSDLDAVASELADADVDYAGLLALDVRFVDADGNEVEPSAPVSVSFETPQAVLGDGVDASSVMVRHFVEDEAGEVEKVETVADAGDESDGTVSVGDGVQAMSADTDADASDASVTAEFTVGSFSTFTITWEYGLYASSLNVQIIDTDGNGIAGDRSIGSDRITQATSIEDIVAMVSENDENGVLHGYEFSRAVVSNSGFNAVGVGEDNYVQRIRNRNYQWQYSYRQDGDHWRNLSSYSGNTLYLIYGKTGSTTPGGGSGSQDGFYIEDNVIELNDGSYTVSNTDGSVDLSDYTFNWFRSTNATSADDGAWEPVSRTRVSGSLYNLSEDGRSLNVAVDAKLAGVEDSEQLAYKVEVVNASGETVATLYQGKKYYVELQNGGFETPERSDGQHNVDYDEHPDGEGVVWQTTDTGHEIEIIRPYGEKKYEYTGTYGTHGVNEAPEGRQIAELNAESTGTLYQNVLTIPGSTLNWQLMHRARNRAALTGGDSFYSGYDTMYVVIMSAETADGIDSQEEVNAIVDAAGFRHDYYYQTKGFEQRTVENGDYKGAVVWRITDYIDGEKANPGKGSWERYVDDYTVPDGQFLTRFFFASGETAYDHQSGHHSSKYPNTVGNLLDDVKFTADVLPPEEGKATVSVTKTVNGLTDKQLENYSVMVNVTDENNTKLGSLNLNGFGAPDADGNSTVTGTVTVDMGDDASKRVTVTEEPSEVQGYTVTESSHSGSTQGEASINVTLEDQKTTEVSYTNTYKQDKPTEPVTPEHHKYVKDNGDGTYDLSMDVHGAIQTSQADPTKVDIVYVLDLSYSMMWDMNGHYPGGNHNTSGDDPGYDYSFARYNAATRAIRALNSSLASNEGLDARAALVTFADRTKSTSNFVSMSEFAEKLPEAKWGSFASGTNYDDALGEAELLVNNNEMGARDDAQKVVIFISDGEPNHKGNGVDAETDDATEAAVEQVGDLEADRFYAIGVGDDEFEENLKAVANGAYRVSVHDYFKSGDADALKNYFEGIASQITSVDCSNVVMTDTLSDYAELTEDATFTVSITNGQGESVPVTGGSVTVEAASNGDGADVTFTSGDNAPITLNVKYDGKTKKFTLSFPPSYALEDRWVYTITTQIEPSVQAYTEYKANIAQEGNNGYGDTKGDPNTDAVPHGDDAVTNYTSSGQPGFYSNKEATLTYVSAGQNPTEEYPKPVIQVPVVVSGLVEQKTVYRSKADHSAFTFTVRPKEDDAAAVAGFSEDGNAHDSSSGSGRSCTYENGVYSCASPEIGLGRTVTVHEGDDLVFTTADAGKTYTYVYGETMQSGWTSTGADAWTVVVKVNGSEAGTPMNVTVSVYQGETVTDDYLYATYTYTGSDGDPQVTPGSAADGSTPEGVPTVSFTNTFTAVSALPLTGGDMTARNVLLAGGGVLLLAGGAWLLARRRRV